MQRITKADLERLARRINEATGAPVDGPYKRNPDGTPARGENGHLVANAGHVYVAGAYGGVKLERMCKSGGCVDVLSSGYVSKRELYNLARAYLDGLDARAGM